MAAGVVAKIGKVLTGTTTPGVSLPNYAAAEPGAPTRDPTSANCGRYGAPTSNAGITHRLAPAADGEDCAGYVGSGRREQPDHTLGNFGSLADSGYWDGGGKPRQTIRDSSGRMYARCQSSREKRHSPEYPPPPTSLARPTVKVSIAPLLKPVMHPLAGAAELRSAGADIHDSATLATLFGGHAPHGLSRAQHRSDNVHRKHALQILQLKRLDAARLARDAGIVHQRCDWSQSRAAVVNKRSTSCSFATSPAMAVARPPAASQSRGLTASACGRVALVVHGNCVPSGCAQFGHGSANTSAAGYINVPSFSKVFLRPNCSRTP